MLVVLVVGVIMKATCQNIETYFAAYTLYWVGHLGILYVIDVMLADMTSLRNRMIMFGINGTPTIASTFAGPRIADLFYNQVSWRWGYGAFAIMMVGSCIPVIVVMIWQQRNAFKSGAVEKKVSHRTWWQSIGHYFIELDGMCSLPLVYQGCNANHCSSLVVGIILITAAFSMILLPFSIASYAPKGWASGYIIAMEVLGVLCIPAFYVWERYFSPVQFLNWHYLTERTIIGSCLLYGVMFISIL